ncbi:MAG: PDZ domain-containing protein [Flexistipes sinusarabici]|uniref:PDZ domain-containing protein n=1 Tax=Flexistipes sinusarabici TaxID=2352 RepID=A0A5D0MJ91_FLESI|nr:PDZ domain-containing protein [Flexistipes sinusarabici]TYB33046.1 MAG: PDZ domain-containing protein [Flexistipes sinusarabici]
MLNTKINFIVCSIILAFGAAVFVSGYIDYRFHPPLLDNVPDSIKNSELADEVFNRELVVEKNIFSLQTGLATENTASKNAPAQSTSTNKAETSTKPAEEFEGELLGVLAGDGTYLAIVKFKGDVLILRKGVPQKGLELMDVFPDSVNLKYKGDIYSLTFPQQNIPGLNGAVADKDTGQRKAGESDLHYTISKQYLTNQLQDMNSILRTVFISPHYDNGNFIGYRISRLADSSPLTKVGIKKGDILVQINGQTLDSPNKMLELFSKIDDLTAATIDILRNGQKKTLFIEVES